MNKKIICLALVFLLAVPYTSFASTDTDFIHALGVTELKDGETVSRGEFVYSVVTVFANKIPIEKSKTPFLDVASSNKYSGAVNLASEFGWISGYGDGSFGVNDDITLDQCVIILLNALGYKELVQSFGGYNAAANYIGLLEDVNASDSVMTGEAASKLIRNALEANALVQTGFGDSLSWKSDSSITNLKQYLKIEVVEGIVNDNGISTLTSDTQIRNGYAKIGGRLVDSDNLDIGDYLGYYVRAYIKTDSNIPKLIYFEANNNSVLKIPASSIENVSPFGITYINSHSKSKSARISAEADYIYNGVAAPETMANDIKISEGAIVLIDNDLDSVADVVKIEEAKTTVVSSVNTSKNTVYAFWGSSISYNDDSLVTIIKNNEEIPLSKINEWDVLTVYESRNKALVRIYVSDRIFRGTYTEKPSLDNVIGVDGEKYNVIDSSVIDSLTLGSEYEFCADIYGNIACVRDSFEYSVALYIESNSNIGVFSTDVMIKLFTSAGEHHVYKCNDKVNFCGEIVTKDKLREYLSALPSSLIGYGLNENGDINRLVLTGENTPAGFGKKENFRCTYSTSSGDKLTYRTQQNSFEGKIMLNNATKVFIVPADASDEDGYFISDCKYFVSNSKYVNISSYLAGNDDWYADYLVYTSDYSSYTQNCGCILVDYIASALNENGDECEVLHGYDAGGEVSLCTSANFKFSSYSLERGDIIRCNTTPTGEAIDLRLIFDKSKSLIVNDGGAEYANAFRAIKGYVYNKNKNMVRISLEQPPDVIEENMEIHDLLGVKIYEYDSARDKICSSSVDDIYGYIQNNRDYSKVFMYSVSSLPKFVVSYK